LDSISRKIAQFSLDLKYDHLPDDVVNEVKRFLYDSVGCVYGGYTTHDVGIVSDIYEDMGGNSEATIIASGKKMPAYNAAFLNSLMVRTLDFNDIYWKEDQSHLFEWVFCLFFWCELSGHL